MDQNGSCQTITNSQCWHTSDSAAKTRSQTLAFESTTFQCKTVGSGKCWEADANVDISSTKGKSPIDSDGGKCVTLTANKCAANNVATPTADVTALNVANSNQQCTSVLASQCLKLENTDTKVVANSSNHKHSTTGRCVVLRSDQCFENDEAVTVKGCKQARKADGTCQSLTSSQCLESDAAVSVAAGTKERAATTGLCVNLTDAQCLDPETTTAVATSTTNFKKSDNTCHKVNSDECYDETANSTLLVSNSVKKIAASGKCAVLKDNECFEADAIVSTSDTKGRKTDGTCLVLTSDPEQCVDTTNNTAKASSATTIKASKTKQCVEVANADPATECQDASREAKGNVIADVQSRDANGKCKLAKIASGKCFDVTASPQTLNDVSDSVRADANSFCFTLATNECFEDDAATKVSNTKHRHSTTFNCVTRSEGKCFENDKAVNTSATKALNVADGTCVALTATECNNKGTAKTANDD